jgi:hypothetical protein
MYTLIYREREAHIKRKYIHKTTSDNRPIDKKGKKEIETIYTQKKNRE